MMLKIFDIHTYYSDSYVLQGVSLEIAKETVVALLGRNGVGKTTLIRSIIGFTPARRGQIVFNGKDITRTVPYKIVRMSLGLVPQGRRIFPSLLRCGKTGKSRNVIWESKRLSQKSLRIVKTPFTKAGRRR